MEQQTVLSRSPHHYRLASNVIFDRIEAEVFIYRGHKIDDKPLVSNYQISKPVVIAGQKLISFNLSKLANDFVKNKISTVGGAGSFTTSLLDSIWVYVDAKLMLGEAVILSDTQYLFALDGFGYSTELFNPEIPTNVLSSINNHVVYNDSDYPIYFKTKDLISIVVNGNTIPFTYSQDYSNQIIGYVNVSNYKGLSTEYNAIFTYGTTDIVVLITTVDFVSSTLTSSIINIPFTITNDGIETYTNVIIQTSIDDAIWVDQESRVAVSPLNAVTISYELGGSTFVRLKLVTDGNTYFSNSVNIGVA